MRVLVVGAYGLIGLEVIQALLRAGHQVVGFGRSPETGRRIAPHIPWNHGDMRRMQAAADWLPSLSGIDAVVNAAGALQDGAKDDLKLVQDGAIRALVAACEAAGVKRFVQISARSASHLPPHTPPPGRVSRHPAPASGRPSRRPAGPPQRSPRHQSPTGWAASPPPPASAACRRDSRGCAARSAFPSQASARTPPPDGRRAKGPGSPPARSARMPRPPIPA